MPHTIQTRDWKDTTATTQHGYEEKRFLATAYSKLAEADAEIRDGKVSDAREGLRDLRKKYGLSTPEKRSPSTRP